MSEKQALSPDCACPIPTVEVIRQTPHSIVELSDYVAAIERAGYTNVVVGEPVQKLSMKVVGGELQVVDCGLGAGYSTVIPVTAVPPHGDAPRKFALKYADPSHRLYTTGPVLPPGMDAELFALLGDAALELSDDTETPKPPTPLEIESQVIDAFGADATALIRCHGIPHVVQSRLLLSVEGRYAASLNEWFENGNDLNIALGLNEVGRELAVSIVVESVMVLAPHGLRNMDLQMSSFMVSTKDTGAERDWILVDPTLVVMRDPTCMVQSPIADISVAMSGFAAGLDVEPHFDNLPLEERYAVLSRAVDRVAGEIGIHENEPLRLKGIVKLMDDPYFGQFVRDSLPWPALVDMTSQCDTTFGLSRFEHTPSSLRVFLNEWIDRRDSAEKTSAEIITGLKAAGKRHSLSGTVDFDGKPWSTVDDFVNHLFEVGAISRLLHHVDLETIQDQMRRYFDRQNGKAPSVTEVRDFVASIGSATAVS